MLLNNIRLYDDENGLLLIRVVGLLYVVLANIYACVLEWLIAKSEACMPICSDNNNNNL